MFVQETLVLMQAAIALMLLQKRSVLVQRAAVRVLTAYDARLRAARRRRRRDN